MTILTLHQHQSDIESSSKEHILQLTAHELPFTEKNRQDVAVHVCVKILRNDEVDKAYLSVAQSF